jgi:hypothetical protein
MLLLAAASDWSRARRPVALGRPAQSVQVPRNGGARRLEQRNRLASLVGEINGGPGCRQ